MDRLFISHSAGQVHNPTHPHAPPHARPRAFSLLNLAQAEDARLGSLKDLNGYLPLPALHHDGSDTRTAAADWLLK